MANWLKRAMSGLGTSNQYNPFTPPTGSIDQNKMDPDLPDQFAQDDQAFRQYFGKELQSGSFTARHPVMTKLGLALAGAGLGAYLGSRDEGGDPLGAAIGLGIGAPLLAGVKERQRRNNLITQYGAFNKQMADAEAQKQALRTPQQNADNANPMIQLIEKIRGQQQPAQGVPMQANGLPGSLRADELMPAPQQDLPPMDDGPVTLSGNAMAQGGAAPIQPKQSPQFRPMTDSVLSQFLTGVTSAGNTGMQENIKQQALPSQIELRQAQSELARANAGAVPSAIELRQAQAELARMRARHPERFRGMSLAEFYSTMVSQQPPAGAGAFDGEEVPGF